MLAHSQPCPGRGEKEREREEEEGEEEREEDESRNVGRWAGGAGHAGHLIGKSGKQWHARI